MKFLIYESWNHYFPIGKGWAEGLQQLNNEVCHVEPNSFKLSDYVSNELYEKIDYIIWFDFDYSQDTYEELDKIKALHPNVDIIPIVLNYNDNFDNKYKSYINKVVSLTYKHKSAEKDFNNNGYKYLNLPLATSTNIFNKLNLDKKYDVSFIGKFGSNGHGYRKQDIYLYPILDEPVLSAYTVGFSYNKYSLNSIDYSELNDIYNSTDINLNFHYDIQKGPDRIDFNYRTFDICAAGGFQLCDHPYVNELIPDLIVEEDGNKWKEIVKYYLHNSTERKEIADKCYKYVIENHTWKNRMSQLINFIK